MVEFFKKPLFLLIAEPGNSSCLEISAVVIFLRQKLIPSTQSGPTLTPSGCCKQHEFWHPYHRKSHIIEHMLSNPLFNHTLIDNILAPTYMSFLTGRRNNTIKSHSASMTLILSKTRLTLGPTPLPLSLKMHNLKFIKFWSHISCCIGPVWSHGCENPIFPSPPEDQNHQAGKITLSK